MHLDADRLIIKMSLVILSRRMNRKTPTKRENQLSRKKCSSQ
jgi:hypothetical protein